MTSLSISQLKRGAMDGTDSVIETVYTKVAPKYAVYQTPERVMVQFADDDWLGAEQRKLLSPLSPVRGEINGLIDGWRTSGNRGDGARARMLDRRTADALVVALQGDGVRAAALLDAVKADALEERMSSARAQYLHYAVVGFLAVPTAGLVVAAIAHFFPNPNVAWVRDSNQWWPLFLGGLGALFSIAIFIRGRELATDLQSNDNMLDALLRIFIGSVSAVMLVALIQGKFVVFGEPAVAVDWDNKDLFPTAMVVAFAAGFSERLVGNYLSTALIKDRGTAGTVPAAVANLPRRGANEDDPRGAAPARTTAAAAPTAAVAPAEAAARHEDHVDGCLCEFAAASDDFTEDEELPAAEGGVDKAA